MSDGSTSAIVVSYNVRNLLLECLASLQEGVRSGALKEIVVVDNASQDGSADAVRASFPEMKVIEADNLGYGAGANRGIESTSSEFVLVLNPDTVVPSRTVSRLASVLQDNPSAAIAAPLVRYPDGTVQSTTRRFPKRLTPVFESTIFEQVWPGNRWARHYKHIESGPCETANVDWVVGACLMVRRSAIDRAGRFDETFWMYCEEIEWCWRLRRHGWTTMYVPDVEIIHHEGASTSQNILGRQIAFDRSRVELQRRIYSPVTARYVAAGIRTGYVINLLVEAAKYALGHRRDLRRSRLRHYSVLVRSELINGAGRRSTSR